MPDSAPVSVKPAAIPVRFITPRMTLLVDRFMTTARMEDDVPIESKMVSRSIASAQSQVEGQNYEIRKNVLKYDDVLNRQRQVIYDERRRVLEGEDMEEQIRLLRSV